jgi:glutaredoxin 2
MSRPDIDNLIAEVFALTGVKLTADDPIVAVLLLQRQSVQTAMQAFEQRQQDARDEFMQQLAKHEQNITDAAAELNTYRQQILTELLQKTDLQQDALEARLYSNINQRIAKSNEQQLNMFLGRLKGYLVVAGIFWAMIGLLIVVITRL